MTGDPVLAELKEQTRWLRLLGLQQLRSLLPAVLITTQQRKAYDLADGSRTQTQIASAIGVGQGTISTWFTTWAGLGLMEAAPKGGSKRLASLGELGIDLEVLVQTGHQRS